MDYHYTFQLHKENTYYILADIDLINLFKVRKILTPNLP